MLSAFYDARKFFVDRKRPEIKITALIDAINPSVKTFCVLWFNDVKDPEISEVHEYKLLSMENENFVNSGWSQYRIACKNPLSSLGVVPKFVSIVENPSDVTTNKMEISFKFPKSDLKRPIAICTKPLELQDDISMIMIEWIETWRVLGAEKIYLNVVELHENLMQVLRFFEKEEKVEIKVFPKLIGNSSIESLVLNDCFLRHMHEYEFITFVNPDELIVPGTVIDRNLIDFMGRIIRAKNSQLNATEDFDAYAVPLTFFFFDDIGNTTIQKQVPAHFFFLRALHSLASISQDASKAFQSTETVDVVQSNLPMSCLGNDQCRIMTFDRNEVKLHGYRRACIFEELQKSSQMCNNLLSGTKRDLALWNWRDEIIFKVNKNILKLKALGITVNKN